MFKMNFLCRQFYTTRIVLAENTTRTMSSQTIKNFIQTQPQVLELAHLIPSQYLKLTKRDSNEHLYLTCKDTAKIIADHMMPSLDLSGKQVISETNAGLGLVSTELLDRGLRQVRMYEKSPKFWPRLKDFEKDYQERVELFTEDLFHMHRLAAVDRYENCGKIDSLLENVPKRAWTDDPSLTVVGTMTSLMFIKYLMKSLAFQSSPSEYGRIQIFAIMKPKHYMILSADKEKKVRLYQPTTILYNLLFDYELLDKFPRKVFLPWEKKGRTKQSTPDFDADNMYLVRMVFKKKLPVAAGELMALYFFVKQFYGTGNNVVIPTLEKSVPGSGLNAIIPSKKHKEFYAEMGIFTKFRELTPGQILAVFLEMINHPNYEESTFTAMMESIFLSSETIEPFQADELTEKVEEINTETKLEYPT